METVTCEVCRISVLKIYAIQTGDMIDRQFVWMCRPCAKKEWSGDEYTQKWGKSQRYGLNRYYRQKLNKFIEREQKRAQQSVSADKSGAGSAAPASGG